jgi:hypothetical protein
MNLWKCSQLHFHLGRRLSWVPELALSFVAAWSLIVLSWKHIVSAYVAGTSIRPWNCAAAARDPREDQSWPT